MAREILWTVSAADNTISPASIQDGGVQGEDNATVVVFQFGDDALLNEEGLALYIECVDACGGYDRTPEPLTPADGLVRTPVPLAWTQHGGVVTVRLVAEQDGQTVYTLEGRMAFASRPAGKQVDSLLKTDIQASVQAAQDAADTAVAEAAQAEQSRRGAEAHLASARTAADTASVAANTAIEAQSAAETAKSQTMTYLNYAADARDTAGSYATQAEEAAAGAAAVREEIVQKLASGEFKGERGEKGETGAQGEQGEAGAQGEGFIPALTTSIPATGNNFITINISDLMYDRTPIVGDTIVGVNGCLGSVRIVSGTAVRVIPLGVCLRGEDGADGKNAYAYAREGGYTGTEEAYAKAQARLPAAIIGGSATGTQMVRLEDAAEGMAAKVTVSGVDDPTAVTVKRYGKNLLPYDYYDKGTKTVNGITFTDNGDGTITANGTATDVAQYALVSTLAPKHLPPGTYTFSGANAGRHIYYDESGTIKTRNWITDGLTVTFVDGDILQNLYCTVQSGETVKDKVFRPMIELAAAASEYEPYTEPVSFTPAADGTVEGVTTVAPATTLVTETSGAVLTCTYTKDATTVVEGLLERIAALEAAVVNS